MFHRQGAASQGALESLPTAGGRAEAQIVSPCSRVSTTWEQREEGDSGRKVITEGVRRAGRPGATGRLRPVSLAGPGRKWGQPKDRTVAPTEGLSQGQMGAPNKEESGTPDVQSEHHRACGCSAAAGPLTSVQPVVLPTGVPPRVCSRESSEYLCEGRITGRGVGGVPWMGVRVLQTSVCVPLEFTHSILIPNVPVFGGGASGRRLDGGSGGGDQCPCK